MSVAVAAAALGVAAVALDDVALDAAAAVSSVKVPVADELMGVGGRACLLELVALTFIKAA